MGMVLVLVVMRMVVMVLDSPLTWVILSPPKRLLPGSPAIVPLTELTEVTAVTARLWVWPHTWSGGQVVRWLGGQVVRWSGGQVVRGQVVRIFF